jgi:hypothetical protein
MSDMVKEIPSMVMEMTPAGWETPVLMKRRGAATLKSIITIKLSGQITTVEARQTCQSRDKLGSCV